MVNSKKILFFPYTKKSFPLVKVVSEQKLKFIVASYKGSGLLNKDFSFAVNLSTESGVLVENIYDVNLEEVSELVVLDSDFDLEEYIIKHIEQIIQEAKELGIRVNILSENMKRKNYEDSLVDIEEIRKHIFEIAKPIIYVTGMYDTVYNSMMLLELKKGLLEK